MIQGPSGLGPDSAMCHVTRILLSAREDIKYSPRAIILLIGMQIVDMKMLDDHLAKVHVLGLILRPLLGGVGMRLRICLATLSSLLSLIPRPVVGGLGMRLKFLANLAKIFITVRGCNSHIISILGNQ